jgi:hypothetical protein
MPRLNGNSEDGQRLIVSEIRLFLQGRCLHFTKLLGNQALLVWGIVYYWQGQFALLSVTLDWLWCAVLLECVLYLKYYLMAAFLLVVVLPLFLLYSVYKACTNRIETNRLLALLKAQKIESLARESTSQWSCSVCLMDFGKDSMVVRLPCHSSHVFHEVCIKAWVRVSTTCPVCRQPIN